jgi:hypothetical protein
MLSELGSNNGAVGTWFHISRTAAAAAAAAASRNGKKKVLGSIPWGFFERMLNPPESGSSFWIFTRLVSLKVLKFN